MRPTRKKRPLGDGQKQEDDRLLNNLALLQSQLECVHGQLDYATDEALIDSYIYELRSLHMKYKYFLTLCKQQGLAAGSLAAPSLTV